MYESHQLSKLAKLIGDPGRAIILTKLHDGQARTATELSIDAGITLQTASTHLKQLTDYGLLSVVKQGRHRYYRLADQRVADMLETLLVFSHAKLEQHPFGPKDQALLHARSCYDHLAGHVAVEVYQAMLQKGYIEGADESIRLTEQGNRYFERYQIDLNKPSKSKRAFIRPCLDWSERQFHLAGSVGHAFFEHGLGQHWFAREKHSRIIQITRQGQQSLKRDFDIAL
jgi:DNA-binding transcriptional ArsR family regulator